MARPHLRRRRPQREEAGSPSAGTGSTTSPDTPSNASPDPGTTLVEEHPAADADTEARSDQEVPLPPVVAGPHGRLARLRDATPLLLVRAAHPRQAVLTAVLMTVVAALSGRANRELGLVLVTVLVGQVVLGWHNDLVDRKRDAAHERAGKPAADGRLDPGTLWFALACAVLLVVPLSIANGRTAGLLYLCSIGLGLLGNLALRRTVLSFLPWAAAFSLYPAFLSFGGWGGQYAGDPPQPAMTVLAALLGIGVHFLTALWGLVADHEDGWQYLPLRIGLKLGAARLLALTLTYLGVVTVAIAITANAVGLRA